MIDVFRISSKSSDSSDSSKSSDSSDSSDSSVSSESSDSSDSRLAHLWVDFRVIIMKNLEQGLDDQFPLFDLLLVSPRINGNVFLWRLESYFSNFPLDHPLDSSEIA